MQQHHDAITGTHSENVQEDYERMMSEARKESLNKDDLNGILGEAVKKDAKAHGFVMDYTHLETCKLEGMVVVCDDSSALTDDPIVLSIYNPGLEP